MFLLTSSLCVVIFCKIVVEAGSLAGNSLKGKFLIFYLQMFISLVSFAICWMRGGGIVLSISMLCFEFIRTWVTKT